MECVWCLLLMGHLQYQNRNRLQLLGRDCLLLRTHQTLGGTQRPTHWMLMSQAICLKMITHSSGSQPDFMQWVTVIWQEMPPDIPRVYSCIACQPTSGMINNIHAYKRAHIACM